MEDLRERILRLTSELERRRNESESILNGISEGVFAVDRERRLRYLNPQAAAMLGLQEDTAIGRFCGDVLRPRAHGGERPCESRCPILHARFRGESRATELLEGQDGQVRTVVVTSAPPLDSESKDAHAGMQLQVMRDETDVEAGRRLRDSVLANISHEFRTPLSAQLASIELLRDRLPDLSREDMLELVRALERGSLRLARLVDNLLESTRIEAGELSLRRHPVAIDTIVEEAVGLTAPLIEQRSQRLDVDLPYPLPELSGDGLRLVQVLVNLLANANKFAPVGSRIGVRVTVGDTHVRIAVDDEGPGLPEGAENAIFGRFSRALEDEPEQSGMGLGLHIVKSIIERHGGTVQAEARDVGTRVVVTLPIESAP
ncbi:MAG: PAS domain-containing protein [Acidobacteria bacterium]|nr:PAS domain-containing protein [Acidobacteriota bacterium]